MKKNRANAGKWIENANNYSKKQNIFFTYRNILSRYLPITNYNKTFSLNDIKGKTDSVLSCTILTFDILFHFTNSLSINFIRVAFWLWNQWFYFLFETKAGFSTFYVGLHFTHTVAWVNLLSICRCVSECWCLNNAGVKKGVGVYRMGSCVYVCMWRGRWL